MRLISFLGPDGRPAWGLVQPGERVADLSATLGARYPTLRDVLAADALDEVAAAAASTEGALALAQVTLLPPVPEPRRILCAGVNYEEHRIETGRDATVDPTIFTRYPSSLVGHGQPLIKPRESDAFDYEGELAVVIGKAGRRIAAADALDHVAGYTCFMDGSVRDWQRKTSQFTPGKNFEASGSAGPWLVTSDEVPDPQALQLRTIVDGEVLQEAGTDLMIVPIAELIAFCSTFTTLEPGDVIATGTPGGVGDRRNPKRYLTVGGTVVVDISGVGRLENTVASD